MQQAVTGALEKLGAQNELVKDFLELVSFDTRSDPKAGCVPSSPGQLRLGAFIHQKLTALGLSVKQEKNGVVTALIPASSGCENAPCLALFAHMDTAADFKGDNVNPALVVGYEGDGIELANGLKITDDICPELNNHVGEDIIVTDGTTLLGADDKAGVAVLLQLAKACTAEKALLRHGPLTLVFTVDEEIGLSAARIDIPSLKANVGVTVDGGEIGLIDEETFNAAKAVVTFTGVSVHTGYAKDKLVNALKLACEFIDQLPKHEAPETTAGGQGFYHPYDLAGSAAEAELKVLIRDFDKKEFQKRQDFIAKTAAKLNNKYGCEYVRVKIDFQYHNMKDYLQESLDKSQGKLDILSWCQEAYNSASVAPVLNRVRGGTDGANLSARGLPCPNIFTGGLCAHGPYECLPVKSFLKSLECVFSLVNIIAGKEM